MFVNEKIIKIFSFCSLSPYYTRQMLFNRSIVTKTSQPPPLTVCVCVGGDNEISKEKNGKLGDHVCLVHLSVRSLL